MSHPYSTMPPVPRRRPLASTVSHQATNLRPFPRQQVPGTPPKPQPELPRAPAEPPLPRQNAKVSPPSPPRIIVDKSRNVDLHRVGMLGEGGFARVYEVEDPYGARLACKVVTKSSLKTKKAKTKLYAEIKIHRALHHPNIVDFQDCFEDMDNVYMLLELCHNGSLMDMLRRRRRFTEPESRYFMVQLIGACHYLHNHQVIHRDLKLGNIFLDAKMNVKVGDFGLAALIESPGERKKTICGTPNYIAPEVLFDTANGHSFEVDTWSIGVILYTLIIGRPPFQTKDVKAIYKRIRDNEYEFPPDRLVSTEAQNLVQQILTPNPQERPLLPEIVDHHWFTRGTVPLRIPVSAHDAPPDFRHITPPVSRANLAILRKDSLLDEEDESPSLPPAPVSTSTSGKIRSASSSLAQQEKEFQKAIQPGSPISALLSSARQPLLVAPASSRGEQPLIRKLQAAREAKSPGRQLREARTALHNIQEEHEDAGTRAEELRKKELESQKARIVAQMAPSAAPSPTFGDDEPENIPPLTVKGKKAREPVPQADIPAAPSIPTASPTTKPLKPNSFEAAARTLRAAFDAKNDGQLFRDPRIDADLPDPEPYIASWVDYCNKYGMGYALTDRSVGVHFNDSTTMILSADKIHFDYVTSRMQGTVWVRKSYTVTEFPPDLQDKVSLLKCFEGYMMAHLYGQLAYVHGDEQRTKGIPFVQQYLRLKNLIVFKMSHGILQFNFYDHTKIVLSSHGLVVTYIDKNYAVTRATLSELMAESLCPSVSDPEAAKQHARLVEKLRFCKEILLNIRSNARLQALASPVEPETAQMQPPTRQETAQMHSPTRQETAQVQLPTRKETAQMHPPARPEATQMHRPTRSETAQMRPPARLETAQIRPPARLETVQMNPPARSGDVQMNPPTRSGAVQMNPPTRSGAALQTRTSRMGLRWGR
ncbi:Pkinase-domain-containing protein [Trametopsis cervina]|nr:Pkinase-domain-containing protein [Trametopsis cervina]